MLFDFFPSRKLTWYLAKTFITRILAMLVMLVLVLLALDLLSKTGDILAYEGNGQAELLRYAGYRMPQLVARFMPYSVLLATIITLATLNQNSEVTAMKAAGLSAHQILAPLLLTALVVAGFSFVFNERVVTRVTSDLQTWQGVDYGPMPKESGTRTNVYLTDGQNVLMARTVSGSGAQTLMRDVTFYQRDEAGMIRQRMQADSASYAGNGWRLENPRSFDVARASERALEGDVVVAPELGLDEVALGKINPDAETLSELSASIAALKATGRRTAELEGKWWHKISGPLSAVLMPLLGAVAGFGLARSGQLFARAVIGMSLGFAYFVVDNAALAMGSFGGYPPLLAAWAPFFLFFLIGETVLIRTEE
ncbi:LPS export ABC transporter permease LptG [Paraurantiacibacter namhicola]|uniref:Lipopolysaccharide export system permease protein LptG n=1 Tax=Paraurantiacibacter namhicola TaxID=645517 RepID=A0A1C7DBF3_9SPHN|nr:LPS export ABC transporter permease LptG [Paraurantiacibacter namhicola]ANU08774.1 Lipopolysaccharide export system permease protein LptG [Paraurantiacibacter namhicola]